MMDFGINLKLSVNLRSIVANHAPVLRLIVKLLYYGKLKLNSESK
jgi:hypothetical protein